jgi:hypothetical protein
MDWNALSLEAQRAGFTVHEDDGLWWVVTPSRPRQPSATLGSYRDAQAAWRGAALVNRMSGRKAT